MEPSTTALGLDGYYRGKYSKVHAVESSAVMQGKKLDGSVGAKQLRRGPPFYRTGQNS